MDGGVLDDEKEQVGLETVKDLGSKSRLDAFTCVECGRCQVNCPAWGAGKELNPKTIILQTQEALLADGRGAGAPGVSEAPKKLADIYTDKVLWQCPTCGATFLAQLGGSTAPSPAPAPQP